MENLSTETVESAPRPFEGIYDVERSHGFSLGVLGVCDRITNDLQGEVSKSTGEQEREEHERSPKRS